MTAFVAEQSPLIHARQVPARVRDRPLRLLLRPSATELRQPALRLCHAWTLRVPLEVRPIPTQLEASQSNRHDSVAEEHLNLSAQHDT